MKLTLSIIIWLLLITSIFFGSEMDQHLKCALLGVIGTCSFVLGGLMLGKE